MINCAFTLSDIKKDNQVNLALLLFNLFGKCVKD